MEGEWYEVGSQDGSVLVETSEVKDKDKGKDDKGKSKANFGMPSLSLLVYPLQCPDLLL